MLLATAGACFGIYPARVARLERRRAEQESFSRRLIDSQEHDRERIAAELHDGLGQNLIVIKNRAALALTQMSPSGSAATHTVCHQAGLTKGDLWLTRAR